MDNSDQILSEINASCEGWNSVQCLDLLYQYSKNTTGRGEVVEIGTFSGKSTIALALGQKVKEGKRVLTVDLHEHSQVRANLERFDVVEYVQQIINTSSQVGKAWRDPVELLWIDGGHSYSCLCRDIKYWTEHVMIGGHVIFHDYPGVLSKKRRNHMPDDVHRALYQSLLKRPRYWKIIDDRRSDSHTIVFERLNWSEDQYERETLFDFIKYKIVEMSFWAQDVLYYLMKDRMYKRFIDRVFHSGNK